MYTSMQYGHWGIDVSTRKHPSDYAPVETTFFSYPVGTQGPIDSALTEREAIAFCKSLGGVVKGPFFHHE